MVGRLDALAETGRVEFGGGAAKSLVLMFAGSPYVSQTNFVETILELQDLFYDFKSESLEQIPDEDLAAKMRVLFDDVAQGDTGYLAEALFEGLGRAVREDDAMGKVDPGPASALVHDFDDAPPGQAAPFEDLADPTRDDAVRNGYQLAAKRYDVAKWIDEDYSPAWDGASWLDE